MVCTFVCASCGYLQLVDEHAPLPGDPHRRSEALVVRATNTARCSGCDSTSWAETRLAGTAEVLRSVDGIREAALATPRMDRAAALLMVASATSLLGIIAWIALRWMDQARVGFVMMIGVFVVGLVALAVRQAKLTFTAPAIAPAPVRWHLPLPPRDALPSSSTVGVIAAAGELIIAPLTGRPCIAYEIGVRSDRDLSASLETWLLLEQRSTAFTVGGRSFAPNSVRFVLPRRALDVSRLPAQRVARFRTERALSLGDVSLVVTEAIVVPGTALDLHIAEADFGATTQPMLCAIPMDAAR
ncbi:MAG TPA: hypothetical protein VG755_26925 [Nannocystaceae bacterium]|nr:hypothetical protein [Nannocystaceae bacterium]